MSTILSEFERVKNNTWIMFFYSMFLILSILLVGMASFEYTYLRSDFSIFQDYENTKVEYYINYDQYGGYGYKIVTQPSALIVFETISTRTNTETNIDNLETLNISSNQRGKPQFNVNRIIGFWGLFFILGSLLFVFLGFMALTSVEYIDSFSSLKMAVRSFLSRLLICDVFFLLVAVICFCIPLLFNIRYTSTEIQKYFYFLCYAIAFLNAFFLIGLIVKILIQKKQRAILITISLWIALWLLPLGSNFYISIKANRLDCIFKINLTKLKKARAFELKAWDTYQNLLKDKSLSKTEIYNRVLPEYLNKTFKENKQLEMQFIQKEVDLIQMEENISIWIPTAYGLFSSGEIASIGHYSYKELLYLSLKIREDFLNFYIDKKYYSKDKTIVPFQVNNIAVMSPQIPATFLQALFILIFENLILIFISILLLKCKYFKCNNSESIEWPYPKGQVSFLLVEDEREKEISKYKRHKDILCIDRLDIDDFDFDFKFSKLVKHLCNIRGISRLRALKYFLILHQSKPREMRTVSFELFKYIFYAVALASDIDKIVINNILENENREFDSKFRDFLCYLQSEGKSILYISSQPYLTQNRHSYYSNLQKNTPHTIDVKNVTLR